MTIVKAAEIRDMTLSPAGQRPGADHGDPQLAIQKLAAEAGGRLGIWECQPGGWPVINRNDTEFAYIIVGKAKLTNAATGDVIDVTGGDLVILPPGWSGRWEVIETLRKVYAIY
ncbi:cupin domain-containing protein [Acidisoma cellulosilyticum]|nr:cupin domain-containing protein [Acidisoma cellulosilyticum]